MYTDYANRIENTSESQNGASKTKPIKQHFVSNNLPVALRTYESGNFPVRLHSMLKEVENGPLNHIISWQPHGRCFIVHNHQDFEEKILPL